MDVCTKPLVPNVVSTDPSAFSRSTKIWPTPSLATVPIEPARRIFPSLCTTVARTQFDLAEVLNRRGVERVYDQAAILEVFDLSALEDQLQRNPTRPAAPRVRAVLDEHQAGRTVTWNDFEERFLALTRAAKIPDPEVNAWIVLPDGAPAIRVDFVWREQRVAVETDGWATHRTRSAFEIDRVRDQRMITARWLPIRVTWRQMTREPRELTARLLALLNL